MGIGLLCFGTAQPPALTQAAPPVEFGPWEEAFEDEISRVYDLEFPTPLPSAYPENNTVRTRLMVPREASSPMPVVVILHYWGAIDTRLEQALGTELNRRGVAAALMVLPYHLQRTPKGSRSGELAVVADPGAMRATLTQCVQDVKRLLDFLGTRSEFDMGRLGITGTSLGAIVGSLIFGVEPRFAAGASLLGGADLAEILWYSSRTRSQRESLRRRGFDEAALRKALVDVEPLTYLRPSDRPYYVIGARHDEVVPPSATEKLIDATGAQTLWLDTGHYGGALVERSLVRSLAAYFAAVLNRRPFSAPGRLYAPTLRVGLSLSDGRGLQVAIGADVWRSNPRGDGFGAILLTPKGIEGFLGYQLPRGFSVGVSVQARRTSWGLFWNTVL